MPMFPSDRLFDQIKPSILRIDWSWPGGSVSGTAFVVAVLRDSRKLVIATAKHVLAFPSNQTISWKVEEFDQQCNVVRRAKSGPDCELKGAVPFATHKHLDVGIMTLPRLRDDGQVFARESEEPVRIISPGLGVSAGTRVAWAGFPGVVEAVIGHPQLCYFEGVISAQVDLPDRAIYVVDGHGAQGVSGGPVWHWNEEKERLEVVGIVTNYLPVDDGMPGFCFFEPISPLVYRFRSEHWHPETIGDHVILNNYG
jgi:hypothetical protein